MLCILEMDGATVKGWIIARNIEEARERAEMAFRPKLAEALHLIDEPEQGIRELPGGYILLAQKDGLSFQERAARYMVQACGDDPTSLEERRDRFGEEAIEVLQALGQSREQGHALVDYVHDRPVGEARAEIRAAQFTLALVGAWAGIDVAAAAEEELARFSSPEAVARLRRKRAGRHGRGALPGIDPREGELPNPVAA
jgi:hypothetical protein